MLQLKKRALVWTWSPAERSTVRGPCTVLGHADDKGYNTFTEVSLKKKTSTKESRGRGGPAKAHTEGTRIERESGHRVGEVGHPDWNEPNGTENVSPRWTRPSLTSPPNFNKVPFQPRDMEATGPRKGLEGCCDCGEHINFSNLSSNIKASGFIFQRHVSTPILMLFQSHVKKKEENSRRYLQWSS